ncbi:hypothetical protein [Anaerotignum sp. MB30-C6]|uniref:hypothetical protein n=1 Tax=Anaerotignum sp. MB30-C6 TaxID=3070814 RepID=UPI0027DD8659|nr:hypothetical protein [Anaerotignum sp. MB30-C6]WMI81639.1 hypothetical protein RBQ60_02555 [Anaerotignum sp. MB30-C6]
MKITNLIPQNAIKKQSSVKKTDDFNKLFQQKTNESRKNFDAYQISGKNRQTPNDSEIKPSQSGIVRAITVLEDPLYQLKTLTHEQKVFLNEKYDLSKLKWGSHEYNCFMGELYEMGILSNLPNSASLNIISVNLDDNGNITSYITKVDEIDEDTNLLDWFSQSLDLNRKRYEKILENGVSSLADTMFAKQFDSYKTIKTIFSDLLQN